MEQLYNDNTDEGGRQIEATEPIIPEVVEAKGADENLMFLREREFLKATRPTGAEVFYFRNDHGRAPQ